MKPSHTAKPRPRPRADSHWEKPHGQPSGVFTISIDDGYVEYAYQMDIGAHNSIVDVERKIRRALRCKKDAGKIRSELPFRRKPNVPVPHLHEHET